MSIEKFDAIYQRAAERKGGEDQLEALLSHPLSKEELAAIPNDRWLAAFSMKVFQSGISWSVVRKKWPNFEEVFFGFKIEPLLMLSDEQWEIKATDERIIRHLTKVMSIPANARMIHEASIQHGSFGKMVADWPQEKITELWAYLKKHGSRLGGNTGPYTLRQMGADTFILSNDVEAYLRNCKIIEGGKDTKKSHDAANQAFVQWQKESGRSLTEISQIIAFSTGDNRL
ncbi:TPA: DNA-3-methyladenine glycosylase I [Vibrio parahaemolyticus]|uniref:DNA-3-methyladenine glycosylase I n=1 Tax=Vibrio parahaemolyticus TaxID=670 RepID=A0AA47JIU7_VIBPH|nr:DNA-3-methyladenine glycosylase I [Vibrio parahaemolyticus]MCX8776079.1 DNA-3-methyladenine glycosylase I [Vibrio parahaemolyticus]MEA5350924.1 DNA-3-methyladenine glycosylase I [Vibrio parahaemolyticus]ODY72998.1 3-methyladenine DNA glycosylase [Vibrio parahaemolyticus]WAT91626.1 DNA-3-methyladenine glycosylase I [Vibrio parahaemolyticus]HCE2184601.1 DNA-3-methyladenine glycosylase I [Vibrio parahaemolyticus]